MGTPGDEHPSRKGSWRGAISLLVVVTLSGAQDTVDVPHGLSCFLQTQMWWEWCWLLLSHRQRDPTNTLLMTTVTAVGWGFAICLANPIEIKSVHGCSTFPYHEADHVLHCYLAGLPSLEPPFKNVS